MENKSKFDWNLFWTAIAVILPVCGVMISCYVGIISKMHELKDEITTIKTVLILKGIMPKEFAKKEEN